VAKRWARAADGERVILALALAAVSAVGPQGIADHGTSPGTLEPRPASGQVSPLQRRIDDAASGATVEVAAGTYTGDLEIDRPITLIGHGRPLLVGSGVGSVIRVRADDVVIDGFDVDGRNGGDLGRDSSGIHVAGRRATIRDCYVRRSLFGVYLREAHGTRVVRCRINGIPGRDPGEKGSGIHAWNTEGFRLEQNVIVEARDGIYLQSSSKGHIGGNQVRDVRYGLHYMFSDDNLFEDNVFENGAAGTAIMYSRRIVFRRNRFLHNRGFASVGLLFQGCDDVIAEDNLIADNARGIFLEGSRRDVFRRNIVAQSDIAIVLFASCADVRFEGNSFVGNMTPLSLVGKRTDTTFDGNYWSDNDEPDLDGDGRSDRPFRLSSVFDHLRGNLIAADLIAQSFAATALGLAERAFPVLEAVSPEDRSPLVRPPSLPAVPPARQDRSAGDVRGIAIAVAVAGAGGVVLTKGARVARRKGARP
jgi:nitrous oxidase accessory protein